MTVNNNSYFFDGQWITEPSNYQQNYNQDPSGSIDPNQPMPPFDPGFDPNDPAGMAAKFEKMLKWAEANNININACSVIMQFLQNMGNNYPTGQNRVIFEAAMQSDITSSDMSMCQKIVDMVIDNIFYSASGTQAQIEAATLAQVTALVNSLAGISQFGNWLPDLYQSANARLADLQGWMDAQFDSSGNRILDKNTWLIFAEGDWAEFMMNTNTDSWVNGYYEEQIQQIMKLKDPSLIYMMLMMLLLGRDDDGETDLGGLGSLTSRETTFAQQIKQMLTDFTAAGNQWTAASASDFFKQLNAFKIRIDNDPAFASIRAQADASINSFFNQTDANGNTFEQDYSKGDMTDLTNALNKLMPDPTSPNPPSDFYTQAVQNLQNLASGVTGMSQVTGQSVSEAQGVQQQREGAISAVFKGINDLLSAITNNSRPS
jgi:hypothetical protein